MEPATDCVDKFDSEIDTWHGDSFNEQADRQRRRQTSAGTAIKLTSSAGVWRVELLSTRFARDQEQVG